MKEFIKKHTESISAVVGMSAPPVIITAMTAGSSYAGAVAITTSLAIVGAGAGMVVGVTVLGAIGFGTYKLTKKLITDKIEE